MNKRDEPIKIRFGREFMKCPDLTLPGPATDREKRIPHPPLTKPVSGEVVSLGGFDGEIQAGDFAGLLSSRRSVRNFDSNAWLTRGQLAFLLWSAQGVDKVLGDDYLSLRTVPSGGARHPFEIYIAARNVDGLAGGLYRYLPFGSVGQRQAGVEYIGGLTGKTELAEMLAGQKWASNASVVMFFSCTPYRAEWRYGSRAHRVMLIDLGHAGQNVMLSACALGLSSCCMAAFSQRHCDAVLGLDGESEYTVYAIAVGRECENQSC